MKLYDLAIRDHLIEWNFEHGRDEKIREIVIHHNAGWHNDPVVTWKTREASAHYQVWHDGKIDNIVRDRDTAWHAHEANPYSIGIEHEDASLAPRWEISDAGLHVSAKLVGYLCAKHGLGAPKLGKNVTTHNAVESDGVGVDSGTACPGPYFIRVLKNKNHWYWKEAIAAYKRAKAPSAPVKVIRKAKPRKSVKAVAREVLAGKWGNGDARKRKLEKAGYNYAKVQREVNNLL